MISETVEASYDMMFLMVGINVALRKQICQKIGSERIERTERERIYIYLLQGCTPTVARAMVVNAAQLSSYSQAKQMLLKTSMFMYCTCTYISTTKF